MYSIRRHVATLCVPFGPILQHWMRSVVLQIFLQESWWRKPFCVLHKIDRMTEYCRVQVCSWLCGRSAALVKRLFFLLRILLLLLPLLILLLLLLLLALALQLFVCFGFLSQLIPNLPIQRQFFPTIHIRFLHIVTSYSWSSCPSASHYSIYHPWGSHALCVS
jgi:hypothetical protein